MSDNNRIHQRTHLKVNFKIWSAGLEPIVVSTRDVSDGGVFLITDGLDNIPDVGTQLMGQVQGLMENAPIVEMEVVRLEPMGMGLRFLEL